MDTLREYLNALSLDDQEAFASRCGTSIGYLRKAISLGQRLGPDIVVSIERESGGLVRCEDLRGDVNWSYLRGSAA